MFLPGSHASILLRYPTCPCLPHAPPTASTYVPATQGQSVMPITIVETSPPCPSTSSWPSPVAVATLVCSTPLGQQVHSHLPPHPHQPRHSAAPPAAQPPHTMAIRLLLHRLPGSDSPWSLPVAQSTGAARRYCDIAEGVPPMHRPAAADMLSRWADMDSASDKR